MNSKKIGWQKYEDAIEKQLKSPITRMFMDAERNSINKSLDEYETGDEDETYDDNDYASEMPRAVAVSESLVQEAFVAANFDCWIGHTNFDITKSVQNTLQKIPGIEILKVNSRYRFFIGIGKLFSSREVKKNIESELVTSEMEIDN